MNDRVPMVPDISTLDVNELEALIARATTQRWKLTPEVPTELPKHTYGIFDPAWRLTKHEQNTVLHLRHPGFGWLSFLLPPHEAANLGAVLSKIALLQEEIPAQEPPTEVIPAANSSSS